MPSATSFSLSLLSLLLLLLSRRFISLFLLQIIILAYTGPPLAPLAAIQARSSFILVSLFSRPLQAVLLALGSLEARSFSFAQPGSWPFVFAAWGVPCVGRCSLRRK